MRVKVGGPLAHRWSSGKIESWTGAVLQVDDDDAEQVGFFRQLASVGNATMLDDPGADKPDPAPESPEPPEVPPAVERVDKADEPAPEMADKIGRPAVKKAQARAAHE